MENYIKIIIILAIIITAFSKKKKKKKVTSSPNQIPPWQNLYPYPSDQEYRKYARRQSKRVATVILIVFLLIIAMLFGSLVLE